MLVGLNAIVMAHTRCLKLTYCGIYVLVCALAAFVHYARYSASYGTLVKVRSLNATAMRTIVELRGLKQSSSVPAGTTTFPDRDSIENMILDSGAVYESELNYGTKMAVTQPAVSTKTFSSAGEFLESVEDSRESVWLVHIIMNGHYHQQDHACSSQHSSRFVSNETWNQINTSLSKFGILTGTFDCARNEYFCRVKSWNRSQLVLGLLKYNLYRSSKQPFQDFFMAKEFVQFYTFNSCERNDYDNVFKWVKYRLERADRPTPILNDIQVYYVQNKSSNLPLYFSAISFKYSKRVKFNVISDLNETEETKKCAYDHSSSTPIYLIVAEAGCYNYGTYLNEIPNYAHLNHFLLSLYPDMNSLFIISFFFLNSFLILIFFEYNTSLVRQFMRGISYLFLSNLILFSIWLLTINTSSKQILHLTDSIAAYLSRFLVWFRFLTMYSHTTRFIAASTRFFAFYYVYINPCLLIFNYCFLCVIFYFHTWYNHWIINKTCLLPIQTIKRNKRQQSRDHQRLNTSPHHHPGLTDVDISITELINQINGVTSIWLQSSTYADRLIAELPSIEYCRCMAKLRSHDFVAAESDQDNLSSSSSSSSNEEDNEFAACRCGRNSDDMKAYLKTKFVVAECSICLDKYAPGCCLTLFPCGHLFHRKCIYEWFMNSSSYKCPVCRTSVYKFKKSI